jgi:hypothetical protein
MGVGDTKEQPSIDWNEIPNKYAKNDFNKYVISSDNIGCRAKSDQNVKYCDKKFGRNIVLGNKRRKCGALPEWYRSPCYALYERKDLKYCLTNPDTNTDCHPDLRSNVDIYNKAWQYMIRDSVNSKKLPSGDLKYHMDLFINSNSDRKKMYKDIMEELCNRGDYVDNINCKKYCSENMGKCAKTDMRICNANFGSEYMKGNYQKYCKDLKDTLDTNSNEYELNARNLFMRKEFDNYKALGVRSFAEEDIKELLIKDSQNINLPPSIAMDYDSLWNSHCSKIKDDPSVPREDREMCSCFLSQRELLDKGYASRPDCLNQTCATSTKAYKPYSTVRLYRPDCSGSECKIQSCQNVCTQNILVDAGTVGIVQNINLIQNCFNSNKAQIIKMIDNELNKSIGNEMVNYKKACIYIEEEHGLEISGEDYSKNFDSLKTIQNQEFLKMAFDDYPYLFVSGELTTYKSLITEMLTIVASVKSKINSLHATKWDSDLPAETREEYNARKLELLSKAGELEKFIRGLEELIIGMTDKFESYTRNRKSLLENMKSLIKLLTEQFPGEAMIKKFEEMYSNSESEKNLDIIQNNYVGMETEYNDFVEAKNTEIEQMKIEMENLRNEISAIFENPLYQTYIENNERLLGYKNENPTDLAGLKILYEKIMNEIKTFDEIKERNLNYENQISSTLAELNDMELYEIYNDLKAKDILASDAEWKSLINMVNEKYSMAMIIAGNRKYSDRVIEILSQLKTNENYEDLIKEYNKLNTSETTEIVWETFIKKIQSMITKLVPAPDPIPISEPIPDPIVPVEKKEKTEMSWLLIIIIFISGSIFVVLPIIIFIYIIFYRRRKKINTNINTNRT